MSAAHGHAQLSGRAQAVLVHVECGTQSLAGAVHNAAKGRVPVLVIAGTSPATQEGELTGSRNEFIQWIQDVADQRGIVRGYVNYDHEIRFGANAKQIVHRALQIAHSDPRGPVYVMAGREVLEAQTTRVEIRPEHWRAVAPAALPAEAAAGIARTLLAARRPLVVTSFVGRNPAAVATLEQALRGAGRRRAGIGAELRELPGDRADVPRLPVERAAAERGARRGRFHRRRRQRRAVDTRGEPAAPGRAHRAHRPGSAQDAHAALVHPGRGVVPRRRGDRARGRSWRRRARLRRADAEAGIAERRVHFTRQHETLQRALADDERPRTDGISPEHLTAAVREAVGDEAVVMSEAVTNFHVVTRHMRRRRPGTLFTSGGGSLGWSGGAAIGAKLARPDALVVALCGDGTYLFSQPATVHWMARRYSTPFLQVIYNNGGWRAPRAGVLALHPDGAASRAVGLDTEFAPDPDYAGIAAAAGGAYARTISRPEEVVPALQGALEAVRGEGRCAVIDARIAQR